MTIFRPDRVNKRAFSGNAGFVGPTVATTCSQGAGTPSQACYNTCDACVSLGLGTRYIDACGCPCCDVVCSCVVTSITRTVPSGMWRTSEQYEAKTRDSWGLPSASCGPESCLCNINPGYACLGGPNTTDQGGFVICKSGGVAWIVAPSSTERSTNHNNRNIAVTAAEAAAPCGDWFVPSEPQLKNPGYCCRTYWDTYNASRYWSSQGFPGYPCLACSVSMDTGNSAYLPNNSRHCSYYIRAFRCVNY